MDSIRADLYPSRFIIYTESFATFKERQYPYREDYYLRLKKEDIACYIPEKVSKGNVKRLIGIVIYFNHVSYECKYYNPINRLISGNYYILPYLLLSELKEKPVFTTKISLEDFRKYTDKGSRESSKYLDLFIQCIDI